MGGLVALELALSTRERVRSLALLCTFVGGRQATPMTRVGPRGLRRRAFLELVMPPDVLAEADRDALAERLAPIFGHDLGDQPRVTMRQVAAMRAYDATPRLEELAGLPALVVSAASDRVAPPSVGRALAASIPGARYVEIAGAAHGVTIQCAERVNGLLREHFQGEEGRAPLQETGRGPLA
jgi:pimeloyl-ACP methyl ester carboxylesterase